MNIPLIVVLSVIILLLISCIIILVLHILKFRKYVENYNKIWTKFENENFEDDVQELIEDMRNANRKSEDARKCSQAVEGKMIKSLQKIGFVKYDAYEQVKNGLSFCVAILDGKDDGILINSLYTRNGSNIYAKQITDGICDGNLSKEEEKALQIARSKKTFM